MSEVAEASALDAVEKSSANDVTVRAANAAEEVHHHL